jgi:hypothetical protein
MYHNVQQRKQHYYMKATLGDYKHTSYVKYYYWRHQMHGAAQC